MQEKVTCFNSILLIIIKEIRLERNIHQAVLADICGKTISAWNKIESGNTSLSIGLFCKICNALAISPSMVLAKAEQYASIIYQNKCAVVYGELEYSKDILLNIIKEYYNSQDFKNRQNFTLIYNWNLSILNTPYYDNSGIVIMNDVFRYIVNYLAQM